MRKWFCKKPYVAACRAGYIAQYQHKLEVNVIVSMSAKRLKFSLNTPKMLAKTVQAEIKEWLFVGFFFFFGFI